MYTNILSMCAMWKMFEKEEQEPLPMNTIYWTFAQKYNKSNRIYICGMKINLNSSAHIAQHIGFSFYLSLSSLFFAWFFPHRPLYSHVLFLSISNGIVSSIGGHCAHSKIWLLFTFNIQHIFVDISACYAYVNDIVRHILCLIVRVHCTVVIQCYGCHSM